MWVLVIVDLEINEVVVRGPWNLQAEAEGAAAAYRKINEPDEDLIVISVNGIQPMVYFQPNET